MRFMAIRTERATTRIWTNVIDETNAQGERIVSDSFLILLNANHECLSFRLSTRAQDQNWELVFDTSNASMTRRSLGRLAEYPLQARSVAVLRPEPASLTSL
jgi:isoamylase